MTPQEELQRIERLQRELSQNRDAVARVARLEEGTQFIPKEEVKQGYQPDKATMGYRVMVESFQATDQQLTPTQDARLSRVTSVIDGLNSDAERFLMPWSRDPASRTQASLAAFTQEKMAQLNSVGETYISAGHDQHFNVVRIKRYQDGTLTYTLYDSGHETRTVGVRVDENGERRAQVNAVEERVIRPGASIEALIQAEARKSIVNASPEDGDTRAYQEQRAIIASLTEPTPVRVEVQDGQRRGNCTTRGQRIMMQDILADDALAARVHGFIVENTPQSVYQALSQERENVRAGRVRIPAPELQASESWKPYNSSSLGPSLRFETGYNANVHEVTSQMRSFADYMNTRGVEVQWGWRDGKAFAYVPQTDQASFNYLEQHIRAAQRAQTDPLHELRLDGANKAASIGPWVHAIKGDVVDFRLDVTNMPEATRTSIIEGMTRQGLPAAIHSSESSGREFIRVTDAQSIELIRNAQQQRLPDYIKAMGQPELVTNRQGVYEYRINVNAVDEYNRARMVNILSQAGIQAEVYEGSRGVEIRTIGAESLATLDALTRNASPPARSAPMAEQGQGIQQQQMQQQQQQQQQQRQSFDAQTAEEIRARQMAEQQRQLAENLARQAAADPANVEPRVAVDNTLTMMQEPSQGVRVNANPELAAAQLEIQRQLQAAESEAIERRSDDSVGSRLRGAAVDGALEGGIKPAGSLLSAAQQRLHSAIAADPNGLVSDELARRQAAADGVTAEEAETREPRPSRANIEHPRLSEIAARAAGTGVRNPYGIEQDRTPRILAEPGNARPGGASTASLFPAGFEGAAPDLRVGQGTVEQLRPTSQLRPEVAEIAPADRNASVDRIINRDAGSVLPVAANDTGVTPRSVNTTARTAPVTAANDGATVTADGAAVSAAAVAAIAAAGAGSDGVHPVSEPHRGNAGNRAAGGAGLAMSTQLVQAIQEKLARGEEVSTAEYIAAGVNVGYSTLDTAGITAIDDAAARTLGGLSPRLARVGGPLVQGLLAVPMIYSAAETGDTTAIGAASFGAIGGIGAGMAGQALIPVPGVGFVIGVVVGEGAAKVGGLATTALFNDDPAMRAEALTELNQIRRDYIPNPLDPLRAPGATINLAGAAVSSVGRAVDTIGQVASWGGETVNGFASSTQQSLNTRLNQYMPPTAANILSQVAVAPIRMNAYTLQAAGTVVSGVGSVVNSVGQGVEYVGHAANDVADETTRVIGVAATETRRVVGAAAAETGRVAGRAREEFTRTYTREYERDPTLRGAARATVVATVDVAERAGNYAVRRANEALDTGREMVSAAGSWLADRTPSWLGGNAGRDRDDDETPARRAPARRAPAPAPAPARAASQVTISQQALDGLERAGWTRRLDLNGDGQLSVAEVNAAFRRHGITARQADDDRNGRLNAQEISEDLNNAIRSRRGQSSGRG